jgi:hypothetical protein
MAERDDLLKKSWEGELLGRSFFESLAELMPADSAMWTLMATLEATVAGIIDPVGRAHGIALDEPLLVQSGIDFARAAAKAGREAILKGGLSIISEYLATYEELGTLLSADDAWLAPELIDHEHALGHYLQSELDGTTGGESLIIDFLARHEVSAGS